MTVPSWTPLSAQLYFIGLGSPDPRALAGFYEKTMGLSLSDTPRGVLGRTQGRRIYFVQGGPKTLAFAGFAVKDAQELVSLKARLADMQAAYQVISDGTELLAPGAITLTDPDGNRLYFGVARDGAATSAETLPARLQHVVVASRNAVRLSDFYQKALGFKVSDNVFDDEGALRTAFLRCSEEHHSFAVFQAETDRFDHHCYEAGEWGLIRDWGDYFASKHIPIVWGPGRHGPGNNLFLFIHDPDGNWLEISAELEIVTPDRPVGEWPHAQRTLNQWGSAPLRS